MKLSHAGTSTHLYHVGTRTVSYRQNPIDEGSMATAARSEPRPQRCRSQVVLGETWVPVPASPRTEADSISVRWYSGVCERVGHGETIAACTNDDVETEHNVVAVVAIIKQ